MSSIKAISIVIPVTERGDDLLPLLNGYHSSISETGIEVEYIIVLTPPFAFLADALKQKNSESLPIIIILLNRNYGEAGVLKIGVDHAAFAHILTLPPYEQVSPTELPGFIESLADNDAVVVNRSPRIDPLPNKLQALVFRSILRMLAYNTPKDAGCGIRLGSKEVFDEIKLYGDLHRFFLILADQAGFKTAEIDIPQSKPDAHRRIYSLRTYLSRTLDILTVGFLTRFYKKPLRFFGTAGAISAFVGLIGLSYIAIQRLFFDISAGDRPLLVLFALFFVLGVQLIAIGLVGETIIFTNSKDNKEYRIRKIIN